MGNLARLVSIDAGVTVINLGLALIIGLTLLGITPAYPGIIGVRLPPPVSWVAPIARAPIARPQSPKIG